MADTNGTGDKRVFPSEVEVRASLVAGTLHVLASLREELVYAGHDAPPEAELEAAANAGTLYTAEARAVLDRLETASDAAGLGFPPSLRRAALATRPVDPSLPPVEPTR